MYETLLRPHQVDAVPQQPGIKGIREQLKKAEVRREEKRLKQIAQARRAAKRKRGEAADDDEVAAHDNDEEAKAQDGKGKRAKTAESEDAGRGALKSDENEVGERRERTESKAQCRVDEPSTCGRVRSSKLTPALPSRPLQIIPLV